MDLIKLIKVYILYTIFRVELVLTLPVFDNEFVHIKVYTPQEPENTKHLKSEHPLLHYAPKYRINYRANNHHRPLRRPIKTLPLKQTAPVLENFFLAELDKPHNHDDLHQHEYKPKYIEETFLLKDQFYNSKQNEDVISLKAAEDYKHPVHIEYGRDVVDNKQLVDHQHNIGHSPHIETLKFADLKPHYNYQQQKHEEYDYHIPKEEVIKVIEAPRHTTFVNDNANYDHVPQVNEAVEENINYPDYQTQWQHEKNLKYENHFQTDNVYVKPMAQEILKSEEGYDLYLNVPYPKYDHSQEPKMSLHDHFEYKQPKGSHLYFQNFQEPFIATKIPSQFVTTHSNFEPPATNYNTKEVNLRNVAEYQKQPPSLKTPLDENGAHKNNFSNAVEYPLAIETYTGYDSYNADHVQGLGSGGYRHHML